MQRDTVISAAVLLMAADLVAGKPQRELSAYVGDAYRLCEAIAAQLEALDSQRSGGRLLSGD